jgi:hypothetical protein
MIPDEPAELRAHLLSAEPADAGRMEKLRMEADSMYIKKLTRAGRAWWWISLVAAVVFAVYGAVALAHLSQADVPLQAIWWLYTVSNVAMIGLAVFVLKRNALDFRHMAAAGKISPAAALIVSVLLLVRTISEPSIPALAWAIFGIVWLVFSLAIALYNRVIGAELATREQVLRLELRVAELMESLAGKGKA